MRRYEPRMEAVEYLEEWTCDRCKKTIMGNEEMELQESISLKFTGGYSSIFGDGVTVEADICQHCLKELISGFCRFTD